MNRFERWLEANPRAADALITVVLLVAMGLAGVADAPLMGG